MYIYNVTIKVSHDIKDAWLQWMKEDHIPKMMATNKFEGYRFCKLMDHDDAEGVMYVVQYDCYSRADYNAYIEIHSERLRKESFEKFGDKFIAFRTLMEHA